MDEIPQLPKQGLGRYRIKSPGLMDFKAAAAAVAEPWTKNPTAQVSDSFDVFKACKDGGRLDWPR